MINVADVIERLARRKVERDMEWLSSKNSTRTPGSVLTEVTMPTPTETPKTAIEIADAICDAMFGPSPYKGVTLLELTQQQIAEIVDSVFPPEPERYALCALCGEVYDKHANFGDWCPDGDWTTQKFQAVRQ